VLRGAPSSLTDNQSCLNDELLIVHVAQARVMGEPLGFGDKLRQDPLLFRNLTARLIFKRPSSSQVITACVSPLPIEKHIVDSGASR
jgi:hypothetical protein